jgi:hypothetical protein
MNKDYKDLIAKYPELFYHKEGSLVPFALFSFECDIGWYNIIETACEVLYRSYRNCKKEVDFIEKNLKDIDAYKSKLNDYLARQKSYNPDKIISNEDLKDKLNADHKNALEALEKAKEELPKVAQIKEKFGTLRFYIDNGNKVAFAIVGYAEDMSETTCEKCGNVGKTYTIGWHKTLCEQHAIERYGEEEVKNYE